MDGYAQYSRVEQENSREESGDMSGSGSGSGMEQGGCCARAAPALLAHISVLFAMYGGAMLASGARLKWDPSTYIALRELLPEVYSALATLLPIAGVLLLLMTHLALAALAASANRTKRALWTVYIVLCVVMIIAEVWFGAWAAVQLQRWLRSDAAQRLRDTAEIKEHLIPLLTTLERWLPLPGRLKQLMQEAEEDAPWNAYIAAGAAAVLLTAQLAALAAALGARSAAPAPSPRMLAYKGRYGAVAQDRMRSGLAAAAARAAR